MLFELTSQKEFGPIRHFGSYIGYLGFKNGYLVPYLGFGPLLAFRYDIGDIGAIIGVQGTEFRHVARGRSRFKVISV